MLAACEGHARVIAGGTDVLLDIEQGQARARLPGRHHSHPGTRRRSKSDDGWATIGAAVPFVALREHPYLASHVHALVDAAAFGRRARRSRPRPRGSATWCRPCPRPMARSLRSRSTPRCGCWIETASAGCPSAELYAGPGRSRIDSTRQLVTHIRFPIPDGAWGTAWRRAGRRPSLVLPTLNCAVKVVLERRRSSRRAAIAMGPVGPCPIRAHDAEAFLVGREPSRQLLAEAAQLALCDADPRTSILRASREYRLAVLPVLVEEALTARRSARRDAIT